MSTIRANGFFVGIIIACFIVIAPIVALAAWSEPTQAPTGGNVDPPINTGSGNQAKNGGLSVNTLAVFGSTAINGNTYLKTGVTGSIYRYLNFGVGYDVNGNVISSTIGESGYKDGTLEFKNSGGDWQSIQAILWELCDGPCGSGGSSYWTASGNDILNNNSGAVRTAGEFVSGRHVSMGYMSSGGSATVCYQSGAYWGNALGLTSCSSDARLKTNIVPLPDHTLDKIMNVHPATFSWKKDASSTKHAGFIAQDTLSYVPEALGVNDEDGFYTWDSNAMLAYTVKALQELNQKVEDNAARAQKELCLDKSDGTHVCITGDQLDARLRNSRL